MTNVSEELARLAQLRDQGVLSQEEFDAQKAAVLRGDRAPASVAPAAKPRSKIGIGCLVVIGILVLLGIIGAIVGDPKTSSTSAPAPEEDAAAVAAPIAVTASDLFRAYEANEAAAQQHYGAAPLLVSGTIKSIDLDMTDNPVIHLKTPNEFMSAAANLTEASQAKASSVAKGQPIKLLCKRVGEVVGMPQLHDCEIQ